MNEAAYFLNCFALTKIMEEILKKIFLQGTKRDKYGEKLKVRQRYFRNKPWLAVRTTQTLRVFKLSMLNTQKSSQSKSLKRCSFMNIGFNQPKKEIMYFKEISASRSFYSSYVLILTRYFQINAPSTSGDARALPGILPSEGLPLLWQQHVLQDPIQRQPVTHSGEMAKLRLSACCSTSHSVIHLPVSTRRNARYKAGGFYDSLWGT